MNKSIEKNMNFGTLYIVSTPIGNLCDITKRALTILNEVNIIACENTQHSYFLLKKYNIKTSLTSLHMHNEKKKSNMLITKLKKGNNIAVISNAGTPLINDPGYILVKLCHDNNVKVVPVPGACAAIAALTVSGLSNSKFCYEGFLPSNKNLRKKILFNIRKETRTIIFYETSHRLLDSIQDIISQLGKNRIVVLAKELTKYWENIYKSSAEKLLSWLLLDKHKCKGEIVLVVEGYIESSKKNFSSQTLNTFNLLKNVLPSKLAISITAKIHKISKNQLYSYAMKTKNVI